MGEVPVIDAGVAVRALTDTPDRLACWNLLTRLVDEGTGRVAPSLWSYEVTSTLCKLMHAGKLVRDEADAILSELDLLGVELVVPDPDLQCRAVDWTRRLNRAAADSFYLALAERLDCDLWTVDRRLVRAVDRPWVRLVPNPDG